MAKCKHTAHMRAHTEVKTTIQTSIAVFVNILEIYEIQMVASVYFLKTTHTHISQNNNKNPNSSIC